MPEPTTPMTEERLAAMADLLAEIDRLRAELAAVESAAAPYADSSESGETLPELVESMWQRIGQLQDLLIDRTAERDDARAEIAGRELTRPTNRERNPIHMIDNTPPRGTPMGTGPEPAPGGYRPHDYTRDVGRPVADTEESHANFEVFEPQLAQVLTDAEYASYQADLDNLYTERARLIRALLSGLPCWEGPSNVDGYHIVYADLPTGQVSWHIAARDWPIVEPVVCTREHGPGLEHEPYDGHTVAQKYDRLDRFNLREYIIEKAKMAVIADQVMRENEQLGPFPITAEDEFELANGPSMPAGSVVQIVDPREPAGPDGREVYGRGVVTGWTDAGYTVEVEAQPEIGVAATTLKGVWPSFLVSED